MVVSFIVILIDLHSISKEKKLVSEMEIECTILSATYL